MTHFRRVEFTASTFQNVCQLNPVEHRKDAELAKIWHPKVSKVPDVFCLGSTSQNKPSVGIWNHVSMIHPPKRQTQFLLTRSILELWTTAVYFLFVFFFKGKSMWTNIRANPAYMHIIFGQTIATLHNLTPKCSWGTEIFLISGKSRLVKYYNLARLYTHSLRYTNMAMEISMCHRK